MAHERPLCTDKCTPATGWRDIRWEEHLPTTIDARLSIASEGISIGRVRRLFILPGGSNVGQDLDHNGAEPNSQDEDFVDRTIYLYCEQGSGCIYSPTLIANTAVQ